LLQEFQSVFFGEVNEGEIIDRRPEQWLATVAKAVEEKSAGGVVLSLIDADQYQGVAVRGRVLYFELKSPKLKRQGFVTATAQPIQCLPFLP